MSQSSLISGHYAKRLREMAVKNAVHDLVQQKKATRGVRNIRTPYVQDISSLAEIGVDMRASALGARVRRYIDDDLPVLGDRRYADPDDDDSDDDDSDDEDVVPELSPPKAGRPKGSTVMQKKEDEKSMMIVLMLFRMIILSSKHQRNLKDRDAHEDFLKD